MLLPRLHLGQEALGQLARGSAYLLGRERTSQLLCAPGSGTQAALKAMGVDVPGSSLRRAGLFRSCTAGGEGREGSSTANSGVLPPSQHLLVALRFLLLHLTQSSFLKF